MTTPIANVPVSTVPAVKAYLVALIAKNVTADGTNGEPWVGYDQPGTSAPKDLISVGSVVNRMPRTWQMVGAGGSGWIKEDYSVEVTVEVWRGGDERVQVDVLNRAWALASLVEQCVRSDPSLGGLVIQAAPSLSRDESIPDPDRNGRVYAVHLSIAINAST